MRSLFVWMLLVGAFAVGLAPRSIAADGSEAGTLRLRAEAWWQAQQTENWVKYYEFLVPGDLSEKSQQAFVERMKKDSKLNLSRAVVHDTQVDGDLGWVDVSYRYTPKGYEGLTPTEFRGWEVWHKENGVWRPLYSPQRNAAPRLPPLLRSQVEETILAKRIEQFWAAREAQDWSTVYQLLEPAYRARVSAQEFQEKRAKYLYSSHRLVWTEVQKEQGNGRGKVIFTRKLNDLHLSKMDPMDTVTIEEWVKVDDEWFRRVVAPPEAPVNQTEDNQSQLEDMKHESR